jgi:ribosome biogenesis protein ENP2
MAFHRPLGELIIAAGDCDVHRLSLEEGRFMKPITVDAPAVNKVAISRVTALIGLACEGGSVEMWDPRDRTRAGRVWAPGAQDGGDVDATALAFDESGLGFAMGTSDGRALVYDLRRSVPLRAKEHQYALPVHKVAFHRSAGLSTTLVVSADSKVIKFWDRNDGKAFTNIESQYGINDFCFASDKSEVGGTDSGLLMVAADHERMLPYYIPQLGPAPRWCAFLDNLTEELEEGANSEVFDDYRFISRDELATFGLSHLVGTPLLKAYMHGFFIDARLYAKVKLMVGASGKDRERDALESMRKAKVKSAVDATQGSRIVLQKNLPAVNADLAQQLREAAEAAEEVAAARRMRERSKRTRQEEEEKEDDDDEEERSSRQRRAAGRAAEEEANDAARRPSKKNRAAALLSDARFSKLFQDPSFAIDTEAPEYRLHHPQVAALRGGTGRQAGGGAGGRNGRTGEDDEGDLGMGAPSSFKRRRYDSDEESEA